MFNNILCIYELWSHVPYSNLSGSNNKYSSAQYSVMHSLVIPLISYWLSLVAICKAFKKEFFGLLIRNKAWSKIYEDLLKTNHESQLMQTTKNQITCIY